jgi:hypothetical protein
MPCTEVTFDDIIATPNPHSTPDPDKNVRETARKDC